MDQLQLYLNDQLVDLSNDSPIALTFQINNLAEVQNQQGNTSNQFKLPLTQRNRQILGFPDDVAFATNLPYQKYQAKIIQDGLEIIPYGVGELNNIDQDTAGITILSGNVDFFDAIDGKLYDMGDSTSVWSNYGQNLVWKPYDHLWNLDNAADSQTKTDGWIYPVVDYGNFSDNFSDPIDVHNLRPGFFIKTAIELLLQSSGYQATGSLLGDPLYPLMLAQFSNGSFEHGADYQNQIDNKGLNASMQTQLVLNHPNAHNPGGVITWDTIISDPSHQFPDGVLFTANDINDVIITVTFPHVYLYGKISSDNNPTYLTATIFYRDPGYPTNGDSVLNYYDFSFGGHGEKKPGNPPGSDPDGWTRVPGTDGSNILGSIDLYTTVISFQTTLPKGGGVYIGYTWHGYNPSFARIYAGAAFIIKSQNQTVQYGQTVQCERIFPDISQKDLLKDTLQRFGIVCQTDNASKTIYFNSFRDIVNNIPVAKDWSGKCLNQGKQVSFQLGNYAQVNYMQYQTDQNILPLKYGWSQIRVNDQTLPANATLFTSPFGPTLNRPYFAGTIAQINMIDVTSGNNDFSLSVNPRILIDQKLTLINKTVTFTDGNGNNRVINDVISTPYFYKPDAPILEQSYGQGNLMFDNLRLKYYAELEKILTQTKKIIRYIMLTPQDILELDLLIPVYLQQDNAYYYINKIDSWRKGQPTKVELVKLG
ncbi:MAG TPA: hypothetical protein VFE53_07160 [Mucilaginibacter sp.]|jgi:hypothetical protein|nr:hypothetical protein [Mucilaginibacter sp.]